MKIDAPRSPLTGVEGWETKGEQLMLAQLAAAVPDDSIIAEIGSEYGMSASILAYYSRKSCVVHCIDIFPNDMQQIHEMNMTRAGVQNKIRYHVGKSVDVSRTWHTKDQIALLFIDGDHSTEGVILDIEHWLPYVTLGGVVVFHDAVPMSNINPHPDHYAVQEAINIWRKSDAVQGLNWGYSAREFVDAGCVDSMRVFVRIGKRYKPANRRPRIPAKKRTAKAKRGGVK